MIDTLPKNVQLFEKSQLMNWKKDKETISCYFEKANIKTKKIIFATNGFLKSLGIKRL